MALIICPECGKEFSDGESNCPLCGMPTDLALEEIKASEPESASAMQSGTDEQRENGEQTERNEQNEKDEQTLSVFSKTMPVSEAKPVSKAKPVPEAKPVSDTQLVSQKQKTMLVASVAAVLLIIIIIVSANGSSATYDGRKFTTYDDQETIQETIKYDDPEKYDYRLDNDEDSPTHGEMIIYGLKDEDLTVLRIPEEIDGQPVTGIVSVSVDGEPAENVEEIVLPDSVRYLERRAFDGCTSLKKINIPDSVKGIGGGVFANCHSLREVSISDKNQRFVLEDGVLYDEMFADQGYYELTAAIPGLISGSFRVPDGVNYICEDAFCGCSEMTELSIPGSVTFISDIFEGCTSLEKITVDEDNSEYCSVKGLLYTKARTELLRVPPGYSADALNVPKEIERIEAKCFYGCGNIKSVTVPDSVAYISDSAFEDCVNLKSVSFGEDAPDIGENVFRGCTSLDVLYNKDKTKLVCVPPHKCSSKYSVSKKVETIGYYAFDGCTNLEHIIIPSSVNWIEYHAFNNCENLAKVDIQDASLDYDVFHGCKSLGILYNKSGDTLLHVPPEKSGSKYQVKKSVTRIETTAFIGCKDLEYVDIPASVDYIGEYAFTDCSNLKEIRIPDKVTYIESGMFSGCTSLNKVTIPKSVTEIYWYAFEGCTSLESITIPKSVTEIYWSAFEGCSSLKSITIPNSVTEIGEDAFIYCNSLEKITIPNSVKEIGEDAFYECENLTIYCKSGSYAEKYAKKYDIPYVAD